MIRLSIGMYLCFCLMKIAIWEGVGGKEGSDKTSCSCYSFVDQTASRHASEFLCNASYLVSMETIEEWEFIKTEIQNRTANEWWIGLEKRNGNWTWLSNHSLTYDKWLRGKPHDNNAKKFATIVKEFNGTQGLFNKTDNIQSGRICEYTSINCKENVRWCGPSSRNPTPLSPPVNADKGWNNTGPGPRHPSECAVIKKQSTPVVIPILVALAGLVVIVAINIIILKSRNTAREPSEKQDESESRSEQEGMDPADETTIGMDTPGSGIVDKKNLQPREECIGNSATNLDEGTNDIDASCSNTAKEQPYYVNVQGSTQQNTLQVTDTNGHYASVGEINETDGRKDSFVVVRTYSIVRNDDDNDGQTEDSNTANYATVSDTLGTDRQTVTLVTSESGYASVDVINNNSQKGPSISGHHDDPTNAPHDGTAQYAVVDKQKKNSKKDKTKQADNQNNTQDSSAPAEVIYDNCQDVPRVQEQQDNIQHNLADNVPNAGATVEYAAVNKSMKKKNRSVKEAAQPSTPAEASYACVDVEYCQEVPPVQKQRGSRRKKNNEGHAQADTVSTSGTAQLEYAAVDKSKKRNRSAKNAAKSSKPTEASYTCDDVKGCQEVPPVQEQKGSRRKKNTEEDAQADVSTSGTAQVEYAAVDKSKKRNRSVKNAAKSSKSTEASHPCVDVEGSQDGAQVQGQRGSRRKKKNEQHTLAENVPNAGVKVEYAEVDKTKKTNRSVKEVAKPSEPTESSYASVDVIYDNC